MSKPVNIEESRLKIHVLFCTQLCLTFCDPMDCSLPGPLSTGFSRQEYWSGLPFPSPGNLPKPGVEPRSRASQNDSSSLSHQDRWHVSNASPLENLDESCFHNCFLHLTWIPCVVLKFYFFFMSSVNSWRTVSQSFSPYDEPGLGDHLSCLSYIFSLFV